MSSTRSLDPGARDRSLVVHLLRALPVGLVISLLTLLLEHTGWASGLEMAALDGVLLASRSLDPKNVVVVAITEQDYSDLFDETSPLDPRVVHDLIDAIALGRPRAIGVDLDTSARKFRTFEPSADWPPIVWACGAEPAEGDRFEVGSVLGGLDLSPRPARGVALLPASFDSVLREYRRWFPTSPAGDLQPSFPRALAEQAGLLPTSSDERRDEDLILNALTSPSSIPRISARDALSASAAAGWRESGPLEGKVVLLGGTYRAGRDRHPTPAGDRDGVELMAQAVELELQDAGIHHVGHGWMLLLELCAAMVLAWIGYRFPPLAVVCISLGLVPLLGVLCSFMLFSSFALWANFALPLVGVVLHQMYDYAHESRSKIRECRSRICELEEALAKSCAQRQSPAATNEPQ